MHPCDVRLGGMEIWRHLDWDCHRLTAGLSGIRPCSREMECAGAEGKGRPIFGELHGLTLGCLRWKRPGRFRCLFSKCETGLPILRHPGTCGKCLATRASLAALAIPFIWVCPIRAGTLLGLQGNQKENYHLVVRLHFYPPPLGLL